MKQWRDTTAKEITPLTFFANSAILYTTCAILFQATVQRIIMAISRGAVMRWGVSLYM